MPKRYTISVDFDGTLVDHAFPEIGALKKGAKEALTKLHEHFDVVISSCRASQLFRKTPTALSAKRLVEIVERHMGNEEVRKMSGRSTRAFINHEAAEKDIEEYLHDCRPKAIPDQKRADGRDYVKEMKDFLDANEIPYTRIDMGDEGKVVAVAYIDDRGVRYSDDPGYGWEKIADAVISIYGAKK